MLRRVLISTVAVGFDGTATAAEAVKVAADMAKAFDAELVLLSAHNGSDELPSDGESVELQWAHTTSSRIGERIEELTRELSARGIECRSRVGEGDPADVLVRLAQECEADVLVIGNKGMHRRFLGSVPTSVARNAGCSVFVVKTT